MHDPLQAPGFLGRGWSFPPRFDNPGRTVALVSAEEDIRQSLHLLLRTEPGERVMQPEYGCPLRQFLFDGLLATRIAHLQDVVRRAILRFEPRVLPGAVSAHLDNLADGVLLLEIDYTVRALNSRHNVVFPFYKYEATLLASSVTP